MNFVFGVDIYAFNKPVDWDAVRREGTKFVFVKASENNFADPGFVENWQKAREAGMLRAAYHYFHPEFNTAAQQADMFIQTVGADKGELMPILDLENVYTRNAKKERVEVPLPQGNALASRIKTWLDIVEQAFGRKPMLYTRTEFLVSHGLVPGPAWAKDYPLWIAQYPYVLGANNKWIEMKDAHQTPVQGPKMPNQPAGYQAWKFWQYSAHGRLNGFPPNEDVDFNFFNGTLAQLYQLANLAVPDLTKYTVQQGDTLQVIANKHDVDLKELVELNNAVLIQPGKQLSIPARFVPPVVVQPGGPGPGAGPVAAPVTQTFKYVVQPTDVLGDIALRFRTTVEAIMALNPQIKDKNIIIDGDTLLIPKV